MGEVKEECGVAGVYIKNPKTDKIKVPEILHDLLFLLQHRGQKSTGISTFNPEPIGYERKLNVYKEVVSVDDLFRIADREEFKQVIERYRGVAGTGHVRYSTAGKAVSVYDHRQEAQPFLRRHGRPWKRFSIAFNGNLANYPELKKEMLDEGYDLDTETDTEVMMHLISLNLKRLSTEDATGRSIKPSLFDVYSRLVDKLDGSYSLVSLFGDGNLVVLRDPLGFKPLVWGENSDYLVFASESVALAKLGISNIYSVKPGDCMIFDGKDLQVRNLKASEKKARCHFEWVYFSKASSVIDGVSVNSARENLGRALAMSEPLKEQIKTEPEEYVVVPAPNTAIPAAETFAAELGIRYSMAFERSDVSRGFINKPEDRKRIMGRKYVVIPERIKGKKVFIIEDSVVRGETSSLLIELCREAMAREVHLRSTGPPITYPCYYGIDFPTYSELVANKVSKENFEKGIASHVGADSMHYQRIEDLVAATRFNRDELCLACLNGQYPTPAGKKRAEEARECQERDCI